MLTYEILPILCDDIHYIDSQPFNETTKSTSMLLEIEKHLNIVNASKPDQRIIDSYLVSQVKYWFDTHIVYDNFAKLSLHEFIFVKHSDSLYNCYNVNSLGKFYSRP